MGNVKMHRLRYGIRVDLEKKRLKITLMTPSLEKSKAKEEDSGIFIGYLHILNIPVKQKIGAIEDLPRKSRKTRKLER